MVKKLCKLTFIKEDTEVTLLDSEYPINLRDFILSFPCVYYKYGVWSGYEKLLPKTAIAYCNNSPYGGDIHIEYDEKWADGECDGRCSIYISCPSYCDML